MSGGFEISVGRFHGVATHDFGALGLVFLIVPCAMLTADRLKHSRSELCTDQSNFHQQVPEDVVGYIWLPALSIDFAPLCLCRPLDPAREHRHSPSVCAFEVRYSRLGSAGEGGSIEE